MQASQQQTDEELLRRTREGDADAFALLYRRRQAGVYRFALQMCGSRAAAEDVVQEVFMALMREAGRFDPARGTLAAYLYGIARKQVLRRLEKERPFVALAEESGEACARATVAHLPAAHDPLGELARRELVAAVRQAVLTLPAHYREVVVLCELHELSYAEAAQALDCAVGTVRSRLHRARSLLLERLHALNEKEAAPRRAGSVRCFA